MVHVLIQTPSLIGSLLLEMKALLELKQDVTLLRQDPLVGSEIEGMYDRTLKMLNVQLEMLTDLDNAGYPTYFGNTKINRVLSQHLSEVFFQTYPSYFPVASETFVRKEIKRSLSNVRRKLLRNVFEPQWWNTPMLGFDEATSSIATTFRTVLRNTGMIQTNPRTGENYFFSGQEKYHRLQPTWNFLKDFFQSAGRKSLRDFMTTLQSPPYGLRTGIIPFVFAVGWKHFAKSVSLYRNDEYIPDVLGSTIEDLFKKSMKSMLLWSILL